VASKSSAELNQETGTKGHLLSLDTFSGLLECPKCIYGQGCVPNPIGELTALPMPLSWWGGAHCPFPNIPFPAVGLWPWILGLWFLWVPRRQFPSYVDGFMSIQNCCKGFRFEEEVEKHWCWLRDSGRWNVHRRPDGIMSRGFDSLISFDISKMVHKLETRGEWVKRTTGWCRFTWKLSLCLFLAYVE